MSEPQILVLLATHNGLAWLPEQVDSILGQQGVAVRLLVSDDQSADDSAAWVQSLAERDARVTLLPAAGSFGSAARNFYRLLREADFTGADYVAFADQDDVWYPDKLTRAVTRLRQQGAVAVSSNVIAFWPDGRRELVDKAQPQQAYDYLFEAAGPGCTYVMTRAFAQEVQEQLIQLLAAKWPMPSHHDWYCYALCRARGEQWVIDSKPSMDYRQHGANEVGVNSGVKAIRGRYRKIASGWYLREVLGMVGLARAQCPGDATLGALALRLGRGSVVDRFVLALQVRKFRRRARDRFALAVYFLSGIFWNEAIGR